MGNIKKTNKRKTGESGCISFWLTDLTYRRERTRFNERKTVFLCVCYFPSISLRSVGVGSGVVSWLLLFWVAYNRHQEQHGRVHHNNEVCVCTKHPYTSEFEILFFSLLCVLFFTSSLLFFITSIFLGSSPLAAFRAHAACLLEFQSYRSK